MGSNPTLSASNAMFEPRSRKRSGFLVSGPLWTHLASGRDALGDSLEYPRDGNTLVVSTPGTGTAASATRSADAYVFAIHAPRRA